jgi:hypothetical protein
MFSFSENAMPTSQPQTKAEQATKSAPERKSQAKVTTPELAIVSPELQTALANPLSARPETILRLQRMAGNRAVTRLIQRKVTVGPAHDHYEQEADRVAQQVMSAPAPVAAPLQRVAEDEEEPVQAMPLAASITPLVQRQADEDEELQAKPLLQREAAPEEEELQTKSLLQREAAPEEEELQAKPLLQRQVEEDEELQAKAISNGESFVPGADFEQRLSAQKSGGQPIPGDTRQFMESRFGADFSGVRVHADSAAVQLNREVQAQAFTHGNDIFMGEGSPSLDSEGGGHLLAHELTHTLQQGASYRIQRWWPTGHKLVTEQAFAQDNMTDIYGPRARRLLIDRSPDMDFVQDQQDKMNDGISLSKARIKEYNNLIRQGKKDPTKTVEAWKMWDENYLHMRRPEYMLSHGEGGRYKVDDASSINEGMTSMLVNKAAEQWDWDKPETFGKSLSTLSDALHQAEDRGSHGEGNAFSGHDVRLTAKKWQEMGRDVRPWEKLPSIATANWEPDDMSVNKKGAVLAVGYAVGALTKFQATIHPPEGQQIELPERGGGVPELRKAKIVKILPAMPSGTLGEKAYASTGGGVSYAGKKGTLEQLVRDKEGVSPEAWNRARQAPSHERPGQEGMQGALGRGLAFYEQGLTGPSELGPMEEEHHTQTVETVALQTLYAAANRYFQDLKMPQREGGPAKKDRRRLSWAYFLQNVGRVDDPNREMKEKIIKRCYQDVFDEELKAP